MQKLKNFALISVIMFLVVAIIIAIVLFTKEDNKRKMLDLIKLDDLSLNGIKIGEKIKPEMKNLVLDSSFAYLYNNILIDVNINDMINYLGFFTSTQSNGQKITGVEDIDIKCGDTTLKTVEDFKKCFGERNYF